MASINSVALQTKDFSTVGVWEFLGSNFDVAATGIGQIDAVNLNLGISLATTMLMGNDACVFTQNAASYLHKIASVNVWSVDGSRNVDFSGANTFSVTASTSYALVSPLINIGNSGAAGTIHFGSSNKHMEFDGNSFNMVLSGSIGGVPLAKINALTNNGFLMLTAGPLVAGVPAAGTVLLGGPGNGVLPNGIDLVSPSNGGTLFSTTITSGSHAGIYSNGLLLARTGNVGPINYGDATDSVIVLQNQLANPTSITPGFATIYVGVDNQLHFLNNTADYVLTPPAGGGSAWLVGANPGPLTSPALFGTQAGAGASISFQVEGNDFLTVDASRNIVLAPGGSSSLVVGYTGMDVTVFSNNLNMTSNGTASFSSAGVLSIVSSTGGINVGNATAVTTIHGENLVISGLPTAPGGTQKPVMVDTVSGIVYVSP